MQRTVMWRPWEEVGLEHAELVASEHSVLVDGLVVAVDPRRPPAPYRLRYTLRADADWRTRRVRLEIEEPLGQVGDVLELYADGEGHWTDDRGVPLEALDGCLDVDISATPLTNTLPVRRLALEEGEAADVLVAHVRVPELRFEAVKQRYTCLSTGAGGSRHRHEAGRRVRVELPLDADGLVLDYPQAFWRVWPPDARTPAGS